MFNSLHESRPNKRLGAFLYNRGIDETHTLVRFGRDRYRDDRILVEARIISSVVVRTLNCPLYDITLASDWSEGRVPSVANRISLK